MALVERVLEAGSQQVSVQPLTQVLIAWDFHTDIVDDRESDADHERVLLLRALTQASKGAASLDKLNALPAVFKSDTDYMNHYLPLMLLECKQAIYRSREMEMTETSGEIVIQMSAQPRENCAFVVTLARTVEASVHRITQGDLVLLYLDAPDDDCPVLLEKYRQRLATELNIVNKTKKDELMVRDESEILASGRATMDADGNAVKAPNPLVDNPRHALGIVDATSRESYTIRILIKDTDITVDQLMESYTINDEDEPETASTLADESDEGDSMRRRFSNKAILLRKKQRLQVEFMLQRESYRMRALAEALTSSANSTWYLAKVMNLVTQYREYQSLMSFPDLPLRDHLLLNKETVGKKATKKRSRRERAEPQLQIPPTLLRTLEAKYNPSQMVALQECLKAEGITCIQGPPGTGKTTTIMGVLSVILNASMKKDDSAELLAAMNGGKRSREEDKAEVTRSLLHRAAPWLHNRDYRPWYDEQVCELEDVEDPTPTPDCFAKKEFVDLVRRTDVAAPKRILVCAPSNAAIDEIMRRLTKDSSTGGGIFDEKGDLKNPPVVRVGPNCHTDLKAHSLQFRVASRMQAASSTQMLSEESVKLAILEEAKVVCATLSVAGSRELITFAGGFDTVVVDEASQGVELSTLIPLKLNCRRLVLVGDPRQLPATVFSKVALDLKYDQSLFQRLEAGGHNINMLSIQYRMHPAISKFPSDTFYEGTLQDWKGVEAACKPPIPYFAIPIFKPVVFFSLQSQDAMENTSRVNREEIEFICQILELLRLLFATVPSYKDIWMDRIAVISPYAEQVKVCSRQIKALFGVQDDKPCPIDVNTVDGFQGREKDLVIFSAVRAQTAGKVTNKKTNVGFLADRRRMNVALTRARLNMWVVGNGPYLAGNPEWGRFWTYANDTNCVFDVNYKKYGKDSFLRRWLLEYSNKNKETASMLSEHAPGFLDRLARDATVLDEVDRENEQEETEKENRMDGSERREPGGEG